MNEFRLAILAYAYMASSGKPWPEICEELGLPLDEQNEVLRKKVEIYCREELGLAESEMMPCGIWVSNR